MAGRKRKDLVLCLPIDHISAGQHPRTLILTHIVIPTTILTPHRMENRWKMCVDLAFFVFFYRVHPLLLFTTPLVANRRIQLERVVLWWDLVDEEASNEGNLLKDVLLSVSESISSRGMPMPTHLLHSRNTVEEEKSKDASHRAKATSQTTAVTLVSKSVARPFGRFGNHTIS